MPDPTDIEMLATALKRAGDSESSVQFYEHTYWVNVATKILAEGYSVVKLPAKEVHEDSVGGATWWIPEISRWAHVFGRREDSRIAIDSVLKEFAEMESPEHALSLAAALIAAARYVLEESDG